MRIEVQIDLQTALALQGIAGGGIEATKGSPAAAVWKAAQALGVTLQPVHPGQSHALLAPFFFIELPDDPDFARRVIERLRKVNGVEAAYVRPSNEPP